MNAALTPQPLDAALLQHMANALRVLCADAVEQAKSGHPGAPLGMAEMATVLWSRHLRHDPADPRWPDRDRFVLSNGHASMLLYALLHLTGHDLPLEELRRFRQLGSRTPGHPEAGVTSGVETTTGPLGQGLANAVGMALAESLLAAEFNRDGHTIVDHRTFVFVGDGCLMEGLSQEAISLAGTLGLGKLIVLYDANGISIDGAIDDWFADDTPARFRACGWRVIDAVDGHDLLALDAALTDAVTVSRQAEAKPTLIVCRTTIGKGAAGHEGTADVHGAPLGRDGIAALRTTLELAAPAVRRARRRARRVGRTRCRCVASQRMARALQCVCRRAAGVGGGVRAPHAPGTADQLASAHRRSGGSARRAVGARRQADRDAARIAARTERAGAAAA